jgi:sugar lactone lactonase YvrE
MRFRTGVAFLAQLLVAVGIYAAELQYPLSIAVHTSGDIYLADRDLPGVWRWQGDTLATYFTGSKKFRTPLNAVRCVAIDGDGKLLAGDSATRDIYRFNDGGEPVSLTQRSPQTAQSASPPAGGAKPAVRMGQIGIPMDIAVAQDGELFVSDLELHRVVRVAKTGGEPREFAAIQAPRGLCFDTKGELWVLSSRKLVRLSPQGEKTTVVDDGVFNFPHTVAVGADMTAYVCDGYERAIWKIPAGGKPAKLVSGPPLMNPVGMRLAGDKLFVVDPRAKAVFIVTSDGKITKK